MESTTNDAGMIPYLVIYEKIYNDPLLIGNVETDRPKLSNKLHNTDDVLKKVDETYETERIADELFVLEETYSDYSELSMELNKSDQKKVILILLLLNLIGNMILGVTQSNYLPRK